MSVETTPNDVTVLREAMYALPRESVEFPTALQEARIRRLMSRGMGLQEATEVEADERSKLLPLHILRPCVGKGRGRHVYEAQMLQENAGKFSGWRQYIDHLSPEARKAAKGLPRSIRDLGGRIVESYWDGDVPADPSKGFGQGAVVGWSLPTPFIKELAENDPELVEASISANATGVQPVMRDGRRAWLVEGIEDHGSVDWVTEAGAGGRVVALMEAAYQEDGMGLLESMTDDEFVKYVQEARPHLLAEQDDGGGDGDGDGNGNGDDGGDDDDLQAMIARLKKKGLSDKQAQAFAEQAVKRMSQEALLADSDFQESLRKLVQEAVADERELIRAEARADADRQLDLRDMRDTAHRQIAEARLPDAFAEQARSMFALNEDGPTAALDVVDEVDDEGKVTRTAEDKLQEAVTAVIASQRELLASANPTRVRGQGPGAAAKRSEGEGEGEEGPKPGEGTLWGAVLQEAGVDPAKAWDD